MSELVHTFTRRLILQNWTTATLRPLQRVANNDARSCFKCQHVMPGGWWRSSRLRSNTWQNQPDFLTHLPHRVASTCRAYPSNGRLSLLCWVSVPQELTSSDVVWFPSFFTYCLELNYYVFDAIRSRSRKSLFDRQNFDNIEFVDTYFFTAFDLMQILQTQWWILKFNSGDALSSLPPFTSFCCVSISPLSPARSPGKCFKT